MLTFRASESGKCPRALTAKYLDYEAIPAPDWLERSAKEGKWHEERIIAELVAEGYEVSESQFECFRRFPEFVLTGHIDGIASKDGVEYLLEIKSMSQFEFDRWMRGNFIEFPQ